MDQQALYITLIEDTARRHGIGFDAARIVWAPAGERMRLGAILDGLSKAPMHLRTGEPIEIGVFTFLPAESVLRTAESSQRLTEKERDILLSLLRAEGCIVGREEMLRSVWGYVDGVETHTLETHIYRLRQKMERDPSRPHYIVTENDGYRLKL